MLGFMKMYEVKKENALQELSHKWQQSKSLKLNIHFELKLNEIRGS